MTSDIRGVAGEARIGEHGETTEQQAVKREACRGCRDFAGAAMADRPVGK